PPKASAPCLDSAHHLLVLQPAHCLLHLLLGPPLPPSQHPCLHVSHRLISQGPRALSGLCPPSPVAATFPLPSAPPPRPSTSSQSTPGLPCPSRSHLYRPSAPSPSFSSPALTLCR